MEELKDYRQPDKKKEVVKQEQLHVMVSKENYERIKWAAKNRNMTISLFVMGCVMQQVLIDEQYK